MEKVISHEIVRIAIKNGRCLTCKEMEFMFNDGLNEKDISKISKLLATNRIKMNLEFGR